MNTFHKKFYTLTREYHSGIRDIGPEVSEEKLSEDVLSLIHTATCCNDLLPIIDYINDGGDGLASQMSITLHQQFIALATTCNELLKVFNEIRYDNSYESLQQLICTKMLQLATRPRDAICVFGSVDCDSPLEKPAFEKAVELCRSQKDVWEICDYVTAMDNVFNWRRFLILAFKRADDFPD